MAWNGSADKGEATRIEAEGRHSRAKRRPPRRFYQKRSGASAIRRIFGDTNEALRRLGLRTIPNPKEAE